MLISKCIHINNFFPSGSSIYASDAATRLDLFLFIDNGTPSFMLAWHGC